MDGRTLRPRRLRAGRVAASLSTGTATMARRPLFSSGSCKKALVLTRTWRHANMSEKPDGRFLSLTSRTLEFSIQRHLRGRFAVDDKYCNQQDV
ncbi:hypothetical protein [Burkholderia sp. BCC0044]|uniref:hypothetical protein n=1 Tax=Burkholderia sp. BCC0044 TaxID=2676295 RepID=UPI00158D7AD5|nr:hypothetical protein [Burkholderia sp. BCC0044]